MSHLVKTNMKQSNSVFRMIVTFLTSNNEKPIYRIIKLPDHSDDRLHFQVVGTFNTIKINPEKIMRDNLLLGFSRSDIAIIAHIGTKNEILKKPIQREEGRFFRILKHIFSKGKTLFLIEKNTGEVFECEAHDLYSDDAMANSFFGREAMQIGYSAAENHYKKITDLKNSNQNKIY